MLQSTFMDPVIGLDIHIVNVTTPAGPVPTPIPLPFVGLVFDPLGLAIGAAIGTALSGSPGLVQVNGMPVTNCGTEVTNLMTLPHLPAPGVSFIAPPGNDGELYFGSLNVSLGGSFGVRLGDVALTCSDPVRLPTSAVLAIPKGFPVLNLRPMVPDVQAIAMAAAMRGLMHVGGRLFRALRRTQRASELWQALARRVHNRINDLMDPSRLRQFLHDAACFVTGHPVDVATGRVLTSKTDFTLPGPLPLVFSRRYDSSMSFRDGPLGPGWSHSLHQAVWTERGKVVYRAEDGREIECYVRDRPGRVLGVGQSAYQPVDRLTFKNLGDGKWEVETHDGITHAFGPVPGRTGESPLLRKRTRDGHSIDLFYDAQGRLEWVRDSGGRLVGFEYDARNKLSSVKLPMPKERGWYQHRRFAYDQRGDLIEVKDSLGKSWRFEYDGHLLVQETDRNGLSFYFQYDGRGPGAWCVRTWGDGGIYDHVIDYDKRNRRTVVTNSLNAVTQYDMDESGLVVKVTNALGHATCYEYDERSLQRTAEIDALGNTTRTAYDSRGNVVTVTGPDGTATRLEYSERFNEPIRAVDAGGGVWSWEFDSLGHVISRALPTGETTRFRWEDGLLRAVEAPLERTTSFEYDAQKNLSIVRLPNDAAVTYSHDGQGRVIAVLDARGSTTPSVYDLEGRTVEVTSPVGVVQRMAFGAEGNIIEAQDATRHVLLRYGHFHRLIEREEGGAKIALDYNTEDRLTAVVNEAGERYEYTLDALGNVVAETGFDGFRRVYFRDELGRIKQTLLPSGRKTSYTYDAANRVTEVKHSDGTSARFNYGPDGSLVRAENDTVDVRLERDALGRVVAEMVGDVTVTSRYGADGARSLLESSLGARQAIVTDALGEVASLHHGRGAIHSDIPVIRFERDAMGLETSRELPGGIRVEWSRDELGRPTARRTVHTEPGVHPIELSTQAYVWRGEDQIAAIIDAARGPRWFDHDARGRLIRERRPGSSPVSGDEVLHRAMDSVGNVYRSPRLDDRRYGPGGRIEEADGTRYEHDQDGNLVKKVEQDGSAWTYHWNGAGMLTEVERPDGSLVQFAYDPFARRTKTSLSRPSDGSLRTEVEQHFVWSGPVVIHVLSPEEGVTTWYWEPRSFAPVARERRNAFLSLVNEHLGTPSEMYNDKGLPVWSMELDIFGGPRFRLGSAADCPWRMLGQYEDTFTGIFENTFRKYDSRLGRFLSSDPIGLLGGTNSYEYPADPLRFSDPLGLSKFVFRGDDFYSDGPIGMPRGSEADIMTPWEHITDRARGSSIYTSFSDTRSGTLLFTRSNNIYRVETDALRRLVESGEVRMLYSDDVFRMMREHPNRRVRQNAANIRQLMRNHGEVLIEGQIPSELVRRCK